MSVEQLEKKLDSFDSAERENALTSLCEKVQAGEIAFPQPGTDINMHCHTFFSYNSYGYSPSKIAWLARKKGLVAAGSVDFDVLDALDEFLNACRMVGLKSHAGLETRVFVPEFATREINSPGEPGISYHMGVGFPRADLDGEQKEFLLNLRKTAQQRNKDLTGRVNKHLDPVCLDYEADVIILTPSGNPTERHICLAYALKARKIFDDDSALLDFWTEKLGVDINPDDLPEGRDLLNTIRAKTMKQGGIGYVKPESKAFPLMADTNRFVLAAGAIPTVTWLNGLSDGEKDIEELLDVAMSTGAAAFNIIPDRNYTVGVKDEKLQNLHDVVQIADKRGLPVFVGTEMNSPGQKFVDSFETAELKPLLPVFLKAAYIAYAHSVLQQKAGIGYTSNWANKNFETVAAKNEFFRQLGDTLKPAAEDELNSLTEETTPKEILKLIS